MDKRRILRGVAFGMQAAAVLAFFLPPLIDAFSGGKVGAPWLIFGVLNTIVFCVIWWRGAGDIKRLVLGIILTVITGFWSVGLLLFVNALVFIARLYEWAGSAGASLYLYAFLSLAAAVLAVCVPRKKSIGCCGETNRL